MWSNNIVVPLNRPGCKLNLISGTKTAYRGVETEAVHGSCYRDMKP